MSEFLDKAIKEQRIVTVIITNGFQMRGKILRHDAGFRTITMEVDGKEQLVFVSAISTIK